MSLAANTKQAVLEKRSEDYAQRCRNKVSKKDGKLHSLKDQHGALQRVYLEKIEQLQKNLIFLAAKNQELETHKKLEVEGYKTQIRQMREKVALVDQILEVGPEAGTAKNIKKRSKK